MRSPEQEQDNFCYEVPYTVWMRPGFWLMETPVTQKQWKAVKGTNPSHFQGDDLPVESVNWYDCQDFCQLCQLHGLPICLPTEAQWEYACRAGTTTAYNWGDNFDENKANCNEPHDGSTTPVKSYNPNAWGFYDMHGNVWEWCADWYAPYPNRIVTNPTGPDEGVERVRRGGSWVSYPNYCQSAFRASALPEYTNKILGVRFAIKNQ